MSVCVLLRGGGVTSTGSDVTPGALNWGDIIQYGVGTVVQGSNSNQTIAAIDTPITLRATWTTGGDDNTGCWIKNGVAQSDGDSPLDVTVSVGDTLRFRMGLIVGSGSAQTGGTVTVTNVSDGGATLDAFTYYVERT